MSVFVFRRFLQLIPILLGISVFVFVLVELAPGDYVDALIPPDMHISPEIREQYRARMGLDQPAPQRYANWLRRAVVGDFGYSLSSRRPIFDVIMGRLPNTLYLVGFAFVFSMIVGVLTGVIAAVKQYSWVDYLVTMFAFIWLSIPIFFLGLLMIFVFAVRVNWFPAFGISSPGVDGAAVIGDRLHHLVLPGITLGLELTAAITRFVRASLLDVLHSDYMRTARAKGLTEWTVIMRHGLRNALIPVVTIVALRIPILIGGAVVVETVFQWPGLGLLTLSAAVQRDYPLIMALALFLTTLVILCNFLADVAYAVVDPRIRYE